MRVRPPERTEGDEGPTDARADHRHPAGEWGRRGVGWSVPQARDVGGHVPCLDGGIFRDEGGRRPGGWRRGRTGMPGSRRSWPSPATSGPFA